jgi:ABC-type Mn2+/Zn2+ transport system permease subunit
MIGHYLLAPFEPVFMQRALLELVLLAVPAGALGAFVVLRRLAFATHALGVGTFPGAVVAFGIGVSAFAGGLAAALVLAALLALLQRRRDLDAAAGTGLLLAGALALGSLLVSNVFTVGPQVDTLLFGSVLGVGRSDLLRTGVVSLLALLALALLWRGWLAVAFDRANAPAFGFSPVPLDLALLGVLALTVVATVASVGSLLVSSLLVVPAATARLFAHRLGPLVVGASGIAIAVAVTGLWLAFRLNAPPGATVASVAAGVFCITLAGRSLLEPRT